MDKKLFDRKITREMFASCCFNSKVSVGLHQNEVAAFDVNFYLLLTVGGHIVASMK